MQALREQVSVAPRYVSQQPSPRPIRSSPKRAPRTDVVSQSRVLSALAAMNMGASAYEVRPTHPFLLPHNTGRQQPPGVNPALSPPLRCATTLSALPTMEPPPVPPPELRNATQARVIPVDSSETDETMAVHPADTQETEPALEEEPVEEPTPTKHPYSYKDYTPEPTMVYTRSVSEVNDHLPMLSGPLGFDMEWKVTFSKESRLTAVVQICDEKYIWVIQVSVMGKCFPLVLKKILENPDVPKLGVCIRNDAKKLYKDFGVRMQNLVELSYMSRQADKTLRLGGKLHARRLISLQNLVGGYLNKHLLKDDARFSDWELKLNNKQLEYAANDAHCALQLYKHFLNMAEDDEVKLTPAWYTLKVKEDGVCIFTEEPPAPARTRTMKPAAKVKDKGTSRAPEESVAPTEQATVELVTPTMELEIPTEQAKDVSMALTEQATEVSTTPMEHATDVDVAMIPTEQATKTEKPKPVKRKAVPRARSSKPPKASGSSSSGSSRIPASSWPPRRPPRRPGIRTPDIVEITDPDTGADKSTVITETQAASTQLSRAGPSLQSPVLPRTAVVDRPSPVGEVAFSRRGWDRFYHPGSIAATSAASGKAPSAQATRIVRPLEDD